MNSSLNELLRALAGKPRTVVVGNEAGHIASMTREDGSGRSFIVTFTDGRRWWVRFDQSGTAVQFARLAKV